MKTCIKCGQEYPTQKKDSRSTMCRKCYSIYRKSYNKRNRKKWDKKYYDYSKTILYDLKINGCSICGYNSCPDALHFHHVNQNDKEFNLCIRSLPKNSNEKIIDELHKCILVCANCHAELHWRNNNA